MKSSITHAIDGEYIKEWLILGPFFPDDLDKDFLADTGGEANIEPKEGDAATTADGRTLTWKRYESRGNVVDLLDAVGEHEYATAYAFCVLQSESAGDAEFYMGKDDCAVVWMNGKQVHYDPFPGSMHLDEDVFEADLEAGVNRCLVKISNRSAQWCFAVRATILPSHRAVLSGLIADETHHPIPDAHVRLERDGERVAKTQTDVSGRYRLNIHPVSGLYAISAVSGELGGWQSGIRLSEGERPTLNVTLRKAISMEGTLLMLDDMTPHIAIPVQAISDGKVIDTVLSDESGSYRFVNLKPGAYQVRCQVLGGYIYYREEKTGKPEGRKARGRGNEEAGERGDGGILRVESGRTVRGIDFRFASFKNGAWKNYTYLDGLASNSVWSIHRDPNGMMWFGTSSGVSRYDGKGFVNFTIEDGLAHNVVHNIHQDPDGVLWFGTGAWENYTFGKGISRYDGREFVNFTTEDGLAGNTISAIHGDPDGILWFGTNGGVSGYDGVAWTSLDIRDGLAGDSVFSIGQDSDGFLWFGTESGITRYRRSTVPPKVHIVSVTTDQIYRDLSAIPAFTPGTRVTIEYSSIDFKTLPEKRQYRCRIQAPGKSLSEKEIGPDWRKLTKATRFDFIFDEPGTYAFEVQAIDRDLNYSEPAALKLTVIPDPRDVKVSELELDLRARNQQLAILRREVGEKYHFQDIIGDSAAINWVRNLMEQAIDSGMNVLITGETGTGKELVAKGIHYNSPRKDQPFIPCNCGAISRDLVASELFGHRKGAFTGAIEDKMGLFEAASGGTVVLDEIGDMPLEAQSNLLRVLEEHKVQRLGEYTSRDVDMRVIAMTNSDLSQEIRAGRFREDLYYRLNRFHIYIPPLRDRLNDIPLLAEHIYQEACRDQSKRLDGFAPEVLDMLASYPWPGNVRELQNEIYQACALAEEDSRIQTYHFSPQITRGESLAQEIMSEQVSYRESLNRFGRRLVEGALQECNGNRTQAAKLLGMDRSNLIKLIRRMGIQA